MTTLTNPNNTLPSDISAVLSRLEADAGRRAEHEAAAIAMSRPTEDERRMRDGLLATRGQDAGGDAGLRLEALRDRKFRRFSDFALASVFQGHRWSDYLADQDPAPVAPTDHSFWWAETRPFLPSHMASRWGNDGLHFTGGPTWHNGNLFNTNFGAYVFFEVQPDRIPQSGSGLFSSTPYVELFGGLLGYTGNDDITTGDLWSKCWLHLRQTVLQFGFGPTGPAPIVLGNAETHETLIFEENADRSIHVNLPGFKPMPSVIFGGVNRANSVFVHLEVRFDIQLEGAGTLLWCDPEVLLRTFQWPMNPL